MFVVFISQELLEFGSYFGLCKILLYQSFAVLLKINRLQQKLAFFSEKKKSLSENRGSTSITAKSSSHCI